jgi:rhamnulokinase
MRTARVVAVDLGASSGRVYAVGIGPDGMRLAESARFANGGIAVDGGLRWDLPRLYAGILRGLATAAGSGPVDSLGIDSWAVDYGVLGADGALLALPFHHRDPRTIGPHRAALAAVGADEMYDRSGIALHHFNTLYQLLADRDSGLLDGAARALLIPDLLTWMLTGEEGTEQTNASTTQLLGVDGTWDDALLARLGLPLRLFAPLRPPGSPAGVIRPAALADLGVAGPVPVTRVASHDTASAVAAVPARSDRFAYISCGTWSLVGVELDRPVIDAAARRAGFTNETGLGGTVRFLRNVMGLWLLQESVRTWQATGLDLPLPQLNAAAAAATPLRSLIDPDDEDFLVPGDMPTRIADACSRNGDPVPRDPAEFTRCILESLALAYRHSVAAAEALSGRAVDVIHLVGGGVHNRLLCQMTADACGRPVVAGPVEAAAIGNALVQAQALGVIDPDPAALRRFVADHVVLERYQPQPAFAAGYRRAAARLGAQRAAG